MLYKTHNLVNNFVLIFPEMFDTFFSAMTSLHHFNFHTYIKAYFTRKLYTFRFTLIQKYFRLVPIFFITNNKITPMLPSSFKGIFFICLRSHLLSLFNHTTPLVISCFTNHKTPFPSYLKDICTHIISLFTTRSPQYTINLFIFLKCHRYFTFLGCHSYNKFTDTFLLF